MLEAALALVCVVVAPVATPVMSPPVVHRLGNTFTLSGQLEATVAADASDRVLLAWTSRRQREGRSGVVLRWFDGDGSPLSDEIPATSGIAGAERQPSVSLGRDGEAWLAWVVEGLADGGAALCLRRVDAPPASDALGRSGLGMSGRGESALLLVDSVDSHRSFADPVVQALPGGGAVVAWSASDDRVPTPTSILFRVFDREGIPLGPPRMADAARPFGRTPTLAVGDDGLALLAWCGAAADRPASGIRLARVAPNGDLLGPSEELRLDGGAIDDGAGIEPVLATSAERGVGTALAWMQLVDDRYVVKATLLDEFGCPAQQAFEVAPKSPVETGRGAEPAPDVAEATATNEGTSALSGAASVALADGTLAIAWNEHEASGAVQPRLALVRGSERVDVPLVSTHADAALGRAGAIRGALRAACGTQRLATVGEGQVPSLAMAWSGDGGLGDKSGVHVALIGKDRLAPASPATGPTAGGAGGVVAGGVGGSTTNAASPHEPPSYDPTLAANQTQSRDDALAGSGEVVGFLGFNNSGWTPPDPSLAVGPTHLVGIVNGQVAILGKDGALLFTQSINGPGGFWGPVGASNFVFDPEATYDPLSDRHWVMASEANAPGGKSYMLLAISKTPNPNDGFHRYRLETTAQSSNVFDSPNLCVGADAVWVSGDPSNGTYPIFVLPKQPLLAGLPVAYANIVLLPTVTQSAGIPPTVPAECPALYLVEHRETNPANTVRLAALLDSLGTPSIASVEMPVQAYSPPEDPPQQGTSTRPETFDSRFWSVAWRSTPEDGAGAGALWATHHVNSARVRARWYEFRTNGWPLSGAQPTLAQWGEIDLGGTIRTFFSAIGVDEEGNAELVCARSSPSEPISMITARRAAGDAAGTFRTPSTEQVSTGPDTSGRWGDYGAVAADPSDPRIFWAHHEYRMGNAWKTWISRRRLALPDINGDGVVDGLDLGLLLAAWGEGTNSVGDLDANSIVDQADLDVLIAAWTD